MKDFIRAKLSLAALVAALPLALPASAEAAPDLRIDVRSVSPNPASPGGLVSVRTRLSNNGNSAADLNQREGARAVHIVRYFLKKRRRSRGTFIYARSMMGNLGPRRNKTIRPRIRIPRDAKPGRHWICAEVDPTNAIRESNEGNNGDCTRMRIKPKNSGNKPQLKAPGGLKPQVRPDIAKPGLGQIRPGQLQKKCPDPAIVDFQVGILRKRNRFQGRIQLKVVLKNVGNADYRTRPNQQTVQVHHGNKMLKTARFGDLRKGETKIIKVRMPWNASSEFQDTLKARIVYDPDIRTDGNKRNDDCNRRNNSKSMRPARVNRLFTG